MYIFSTNTYVYMYIVIYEYTYTCVHVYTHYLCHHQLVLVLAQMMHASDFSQSLVYAQHLHYHLKHPWNQTYLEDHSTDYEVEYWGREMMLQAETTKIADTQML